MLPRTTMNCRLVEFSICFGRSFALPLRNATYHMKIQTQPKAAYRALSRMAGAASEVMTLHRQEDDNDEQDHGSEVQGANSVTPV